MTCIRDQYPRDIVKPAGMRNDINSMSMRFVERKKGSSGKKSLKPKERTLILVILIIIVIPLSNKAAIDPDVSATTRYEATLQLRELTRTPRQEVKVLLFVKSC